MAQNVAAPAKVGKPQVKNKPPNNSFLKIKKNAINTIEEFKLKNAAKAVKMIGNIKNIIISQKKLVLRH
jgi:hypothetical protein